jgi:hypothetical protein
MDLLKFLKNLDYFGHQVQLRMSQKRSTYQQSFGGFITIMFGSLLIGQAVQLMMGLLNHENDNI